MGEQMDIFESTIFRRELLKKIEEFIHIVNIEYAIPLTFSKENLPLFEKVIDQTQSNCNKKLLILDSYFIILS